MPCRSLHWHYYLLPHVISFTKVLPGCLSSPHPSEVKIKCIFALYTSVWYKFLFHGFQMSTTHAAGIRTETVGHIGIDRCPAVMLSLYYVFQDTFSRLCLCLYVKGTLTTLLLIYPLQLRTDFSSVLQTRVVQISNTAGPLIIITNSAKPTPPNLWNCPNSRSPLKKFVVRP